MRFGSVCSGIEAASVAWHPLGFETAFVSEIEAFPSAVLAHHYPGVPNRGDMTKFAEWPDDAIDLLVGGTPCQSFSVAGLRAGLADPRGNLMLTYLAIAAKYQPRWLVWENVPGVLSSGGGRDFGSFLGGLGELGYGFAYRVLDAQFCRASGLPFAVPQRRRRVFVVGYLGDWRRAAAVLFDGSSLRGDSAPRRQAGEGVAPTISSRPTGGGGLGTDFDCDGGLVAGTLNPGAHPGGYNGQDAYNGLLVPTIAQTLTRGEGFDGSEDGSGRGTPLTVCIHSDALGRDGIAIKSDRNAGLGLIADGSAYSMMASQPHAVAFNPQAGGKQTSLGFDPAAGTVGTLEVNQTPAVAFDMRGRDGGAQFEGPHDTANIRASSGGSSRNYVAEWAVRRLTPIECERLQGFPDGYTAIPYRNKPAADGPRYKALGNSMAVNVMRILGERIALVDAMQSLKTEAA